MFPKDNEAGGTWIVASEKSRLVCLLNGAFKVHERHVPYRKSRGIVVREIFEYNSHQDFLDNYDLDNIEPFTIVWIEKNGQELYDFRWDGKKKYSKKMDSSQKHIWSSSTLYIDEFKKKREQWLDDWFKNEQDFLPGKIFDFHNSAGDGNIEYSTRMKRDFGVETVSITQVIANSKKFNMFHKNLTENFEGSKELIINEI